MEEMEAMVRALAEQGVGLLQKERQEQRNAILATFKESRLANHSWHSLLAQAEIDLAPVARFVRWKRPDIWSTAETWHWFPIAIPKFSTILAGYNRDERGWGDWCLDHWAVLTWHQNHRRPQWLHYTPTRDILMVLGAAFESYGKRDVAKKSGRKVRRAEVSLEDVSTGDSLTPILKAVS